MILDCPALHLARPIGSAGGSPEAQIRAHLPDQEALAADASGNIALPRGSNEMQLHRIRRAQITLSQHPVAISSNLAFSLAVACCHVHS